MSRARLASRLLAASGTVSGCPAVSKTSSPLVLTNNTCKVLHSEGCTASQQAAMLLQSARGLHASAVQPHPAASSPQNQQQRVKERGLAAQQEQFDEITDKHIPQRPVTKIEATSYTFVIVGGLAMAAAVLYTAANELLIQPTEYTCFNLALEKIKEDPRVTVRLGTPISAYGQESRNRAARQRIPHRASTDAQGVEHHQIQFHARGPSGSSAVVNASMWQDSNKQWQYDMLFLDFGGTAYNRVYLVGAPR